MIAESVLRELRAHVRPFYSVRSGLRFWLLERERRLSVRRAAMTPDYGVPQSQERIDQRHATYAAMTACVKGIHERRLAALMLFYDSQEPLHPAFQESCKRTRRLLLARMRERGLLDY